MRLLVTRLGIVLLLYTLCRFFFLLANHELFALSGMNLPIAFLHGFRFDLSAILYTNALFIILSMLIRPRNRKAFSEQVLKWLFYVVNSAALLLNLIDQEYYPFTGKRLAADFFSGGNNIWDLLPQYIRTYGHLLVILAGLVAILVFLYRKTQSWYFRDGRHLAASSFYIRITGFLLLTVLLITGMRGGWQIKPLQVISASYYGEPNNASLVLNTPFTILQTIGKKGLDPKTYFSDDEARAIYSPVKEYRSDQPFLKKNVMLIILESFSKEWVGCLNEGKTYTPFLDSICGKSLVFENAFANGKKSNEALPSLLAGIPSLMDEAYTGSIYQDNRLRALPHILKEKGYETWFFHGGANGTMNFDAFARKTGIMHYYGLNEYPGKKDHDGSWGIFDEPFFLFTADQLNKGPQPFFAALFSLSSHHPYAIPGQYKNAFREVADPALRSIRYTDQALRSFFKAAQQMPWFHNTIFIITADHTAAARDPYYNTQVGFYRIPFLIYEPGKLPGRIKKVVQQADLMPTVLDQLNYSGKFVSFGESMLDTGEGFSVNYLNGIYQIISRDYALQFNGEQTVGFYDLQADPLLQRNIAGTIPEHEKGMEKRLKAYIQQFNRSLISNQLYPE